MRHPTQRRSRCSRRQALVLEPRGEPAAGVHVAFRAADHETVDAFYAAAIGSGGEDNGSPGLREHYHPTYYAAFVHDPDGNNVEALYRDGNVGHAAPPSLR